MDFTEMDAGALHPPELADTQLSMPGLDEDEFGADAMGGGIDVPFTNLAVQVLEKTREFADMIGGEAILTEHLILAMSAVPECAASKLIQEFRGPTESLLSTLQFVLGAAGPLPPSPLPSPRLGRVITRAKREAYRMNHAEVSTLHLLMGLIKERQGAACFALDVPGRGLGRLERASVQAVIAGSSDDGLTTVD